MIKWLWLSVAVVALDRITKDLVVAALSLYQSIPIVPSLNFTLMHNTGAAFSFLADSAGWQRWLFTLIAIVVSIGLIIWMHRLKSDQRLLAIAIALVVGGALGNVWDRLTLGYVIDFIDVYYGTLPHWPAFNVADSAITIGAVLLLIDAFREPRRRTAA